MRLTIRLFFAAALTCATLASCMMSRVAPYGVRSLTEKDVAESLAVLEMLEEHIRLQPRDPEAWHRRGMIGWALRERGRAKPPIKSIDWTLIGRMADTSLRIAAQLKKENAAYDRDVSLFLLSSGAVYTPLVSQGRVNRIERRGLDEDRNAATPHARAAGIIRVGRTYWRAWEQGHDAIRISGKWPTTALLEPSAIANVRDMVTLASRPDPKDTSEADYRQAEDLFREAYSEAPDYPLAFPQLAMVLTAKNRWDELAAFATHHLRNASFDATAWMALGLASHRLGDVQKAATAFDFALKNMSADVREQLDRVQRVMKPSDTARYSARPASQRAASDRAFWMAADPLWSRASGNAHAEFLARIAYAQLRWSLPEVSAHGADTERGRIHVRYGPPALIAGPDLVWAYNSGAVFTFDRPDGMGIAELNRPYSTSVVVEALPATWGNAVRVSNVVVNVARFRAGDSVDVYTTVHAPEAQTRSPDGRMPAAHLWLLTADTLVRARDSARVTDSLPLGFTRRVVPGKYGVRAEVTTEDDASTGALGITAAVAANDSATGFFLHGFGLSDMLFASRVSPRASAAARWSDFEIMPHIGPVGTGHTLEVLWETYELGARDGSASYDVALTVAQSDTRSGLGRIAAEVVGALGTAIGVDRRDNSITSRFTRTVPAARVVPDHFTIGLGDTPAGVYTMTLEVTDRISGRKATTSRTVVIR